MCGFVCGYAAVCLLRPLWTACGATQAGCGVELAVRLLQRTSRLNLKLNRTAALTEWRQLLKAEVQAAPAIRCEFSSV
jgi:hypothetical protein